MNDSLVQVAVSGLAVVGATSITHPIDLIKVLTCHLLSPYPLPQSKINIFLIWLPHQPRNACYDDVHRPAVERGNYCSYLHMHIFCFNLSCVANSQNDQPPFFFLHIGSAPACKTWCVADNGGGSSNPHGAFGHCRANRPR